MEENNMGQPSSIIKDIYKEIAPTSTRKENSRQKDRSRSPYTDEDASCSTYISPSDSFRSGVVLAKHDPISYPKRLPKCWPRKRALVTKSPPGRIIKNKRTFPKKGRVTTTRRKPARTTTKPRNVRRKPIESIHTIFTAKSSRCSFVACEYCGHRCCRRCHRCREKINAKRRAKLRPMKKVRRRPNRKNLRMVSVLEGVQAGSAHWALSPLFIASNAMPPAPTRESGYIEITPAMIHQAMQAIAKWTEAIKTGFLATYLQRFYPVNTNKDELMTELLEKLKISVLAGTVIQCAPDSWTLPHSLHKRRLSETHLSLFWRIYADTMQPIKKQIDNDAQQSDNKTEEKNVTKHDDPPPDYIV